MAGRRALGRGGRRAAGRGGRGSGEPGGGGRATGGGRAGGKGDRRHPDVYAQRARREGMPARSVYKLEEMDQRWKLLPQGGRVLDLGCAPGSWLLYASRRVGPRGLVIGYDLKPLEISLPEPAQARVGDAFDIDPAEGPFDVVLSDMAPATMGHHGTDAMRSAALAERALDMADRLLVAGGAVVVKVLEGADVVSVVARMRAAYGKVERLRPKATRKESTEIFLIGLHKRSALPTGDSTELPASDSV